MGTPEAIVQSGDSRTAPGQQRTSPTAPADGAARSASGRTRARESFGSMRPGAERDLVVVRVVAGPRQRVGQRGAAGRRRSASRAWPAARRTCVLTLDSRFTTRSGPPTTGLKTCADRAADDEVRAQVVDEVEPAATASPGQPRPGCPGSTAGRSGSRRRLSMMLMPEAPAPGRMKPVNGFANVGAKGGTAPVSGSRKKTLPARTSIGSARPSSPRSSEMISSVTRS